MTNNDSVNAEIVSISQRSVSGVEDFRLKLQEDKERRALLDEYIKTSLIRDVDYGSIQLKNKKTGHITVSKETLFKPGAEKICSLLHLQPSFKIDEDIIRIAGQGIVAYVCNLTNRHSGMIVSEGRGACSIAEKYGDVNSAIKIAEKRAQIDAVLRFAALSGVFTQDLDDFKNSDGVVDVDDGGNIINPNSKKTNHALSKKSGKSYSCKN